MHTCTHADPMSNSHPHGAQCSDRLSCLPTLVVARVAQYMPIEDVVCLALTCHRLFDMIRPTMTEAEVARGGGRALPGAFWSLLPDRNELGGATCEATTVRDDWCVFPVALSVVPTRRAIGHGKHLQPMIHCATFRGSLRAVRRLVARANANCPRFKRIVVFNRILVWASRAGHVDLVQYALDMDAWWGFRMGHVRQNSKRDDPLNALEWACFGGHVPIVSTFQRRNPHVLSSTNSSPMQYAIWGGHADMVGYLCSQIPHESHELAAWMRWAIDEQRVDVVRRLVRTYYARLDLGELQRATRRASIYPCAHVVRALLDAMRAELARGPAAGGRFREEHPLCLLDALALACERDLPDTVALLLKEPALQHAPDTGVHQPITAACRVGAVRVVQQLLAHEVLGASARIADAKLLRYAVHYEHADVLGALLAAPRVATPSAVADALQCARSMGNEAAVALLEQHAAAHDASLDEHPQITHAPH